MVLSDDLVEGRRPHPHRERRRRTDKRTPRRGRFAGDVKQTVGHVLCLPRRCDATAEPSRTCWLRDEVDQLLDASDQRGLEIVPVPHATPYALPCPRDVGLLSVRPPQLAADTLLPVDALGDHRPRRDADPGGFDRLPDVDERMADHEGVSAARPPADRFCDPGLLRARDQVVDEHTQPSPRAGPELVDDRNEIVDAAEVFDDDTLDAQVGAPYLFDELGIVSALDVDAT